MKKLALLLLLLGTKSFAQDSKIYVGVTGGYIFENYNPLNEKISELGIPSFTNGKALYSGNMYVFLVENFRIGGIWSFGEQHRYGAVNSSMVNYQFGGITLEYTFRLPNSASLSLGGIIGECSQTIEFYNGYHLLADWDLFLYSSWLTFDSLVRLQKKFFIITPTINFEIPFYKSMLFRIGGGYNIDRTKWALNNGKEIAYVPPKLVSGNFFIQTGIQFGFPIY